MLSTLLSWEDTEKSEPDSCMLVGQGSGNRTQAGTHEFLSDIRKNYFHPGGGEALEQRTGDIMEFTNLDIFKT